MEGVREGDGLIRDGSGNLMAMVCEGERFELASMDDDDFKEVEQYLLEQRRDPLAAIKDELARVKDNPVLVDKLVDRAYRDLRKAGNVDAISHKDVADYLDTREGAIRSLWLMVRKSRPDVSLERATEMFRTISTAEAIKRRDEASRTLIARAQADAPQPPGNGAPRESRIPGGKGHAGRSPGPGAGAAPRKGSTGEGGG